MCIYVYICTHKDTVMAFTSKQIEGFKNDMAEIANRNGITAESIEVIIKTKSEHPIGMPSKSFREQFGKSGTLLAHQTMRTWEKMGKIKTFRISPKNIVVTMFNGKEWDGNAFTR